MGFIGWLSTIFLTLSGIPQAIKVHRDGHARGVAMGWLILWLVGEVFLIVYACHPFQLQIFVNGVLNFLVAGFIFLRKVFERKDLPASEVGTPSLN